MEMLPRCSRCHQCSALMAPNDKGELVCHRCQHKRSTRFKPLAEEAAQGRPSPRGVRQGRKEG